VTDIDIDKLEAFSKSAKTPWSVQSMGDWWVVNDSLPSSLRDPIVFDDGSAAGEYGPRCSEETRDYIVALANAAPALIAEVRRLRADLRTAVDLLDAVEQDQVQGELWCDARHAFLAAIAAKEKP